jgi:hypothetical protein
MQRYSVTLYEYQWKRLLASGDLVIERDFIVQRTDTLYHPVLGLLPEVEDYAPSVMVV